ncbi:MAG: hypothetical protein IJ144_01035 [Prevotella sp.]|nr:hypothetical protein [Prevotella sp.]
MYKGKADFRVKGESNFLNRLRVCARARGLPRHRQLMPIARQRSLARGKTLTVFGKTLTVSEKSLTVFGKTLTVSEKNAHLFSWK